MTSHPDDVTILFLDYDVIIFDDVNLYGIVTSLCPCVPVGEPLIYYYLQLKSGNETTFSY